MKFYDRRNTPREFSVTNICSLAVQESRCHQKPSRRMILHNFKIHGIQVRESLWRLAQIKKRQKILEIELIEKKVEYKNANEILPESRVFWDASAWGSVSEDVRQIYSLLLKDWWWFRDKDSNENYWCFRFSAILFSLKKPIVTKTKSVFKEVPKNKNNCNSFSWNYRNWDTLNHVRHHRSENSFHNGNSWKEVACRGASTFFM